MDSKNFHKVIKFVEDLFAKDKVTLTAHRRNIFKLMLAEEKALSAYEITNRLKDVFSLSVPTMSVYRVLNFLEQRKLVHRVSSINKYIICSHIMCKHDHGIMQFAVCLTCLGVKEILSRDTIKNKIKEDLEAIKFHLSSNQIELIGLCSNCSKC